MDFKVLAEKQAKELTLNSFNLRLILNQCLKGALIESKLQPSEKRFSVWFWGKIPVDGRYLKFAIYNQIGESVVLFIQTGVEILTCIDEWLALTFQLMLRSCVEERFSLDYHWERQTDARCGSDLRCYVWHGIKDSNKDQKSYVVDLLDAYRKLWPKA